MLKIKRIYEDGDKDDGYRILVDRIWPRGVKKEVAGLDYWAKEIAPSNELRKNFGHDEEKFLEFKNKYMEELDANKDSIKFKELVVGKLRETNVSLLYGAKDEKNNNAVVLMEWLNKEG